MSKSLIEFAQYGWDGVGVSPEAILRRDGSQAPFAAMRACPAWFGWRTGKAMNDEGLPRPTSIHLVHRLPRAIDLLGPPKPAGIDETTVRGNERKRFTNRGSGRYDQPSFKTPMDDTLRLSAPRTD